MSSSSIRKNYTGRVFGRWTVVGYGGKNPKGKNMWTCECQCGSVKNICGTSLAVGDTRSCGCHRSELLQERHERYSIDMIGKKFERLTVDRIDHVSDVGTMFSCLCDCGNRTIVRSSYLISGHTKSCGCYGSDKLNARNQIHKDSMIGRSFGRLTVVRLDDSSGRMTKYLCNCVCGNEISVIGTNLSRGNTTSCGCYQRELQSNRATTHELSKHPMYRTWGSMIQRCENPKHKSFHHYGAKGVSVCDEWRHDFMAFYNWAMVNGYRDDLTIDRFPDAKGNYEPSNCRWATPTEQNRSRSNTVLSIEIAEAIRADSRKQVEIAESYGIAQPTVSAIKLNKIWWKD